MDFFSADHHYGHTNVIKYENRPYEDVDSMDADMIQKWNKTVGEEDKVIYLGDFGFRSAEKLQEIIRNLNGEIVLYRGNHDWRRTESKWLSMGMKEIISQGREKQYYVTYEKDGITVALSHYPIEDCPYFNIHGHVHTHIQELDQTKYMCVSVECVGYRPVSWEEIKEEMKKRGVN